MNTIPQECMCKYCKFGRYLTGGCTVAWISYHNHSQAPFGNACMDVTFHYIKLASPHQFMLCVKYI